MSQGRDWHPFASLRLAPDNHGSAATSGSATPTARYEYAVEDLFTGPETAPDVWAEFLRKRINQRRQFYRSLDPSAQEHIRKEVRRIIYFRRYFRDYRVFPKDKLPLVALLDDSRTKWRDAAARRAAEELERHQRQVDKYGSTPKLQRDLLILREVQNWKSGDYAAAQDALNPAGYMAGLDPDVDLGPSNSEDDPRKPDYGYNGWVAVWEEGKGRVSLDHPLVHGSFPHQKISIQQFLYNKDGTPLRRTSRSDQLRYFHLPANNMKWVEEAVSRYYGEDNVEFDSKRVLSLKYNSQRLLRNELWRGQQRGGKGLPAHARQIGPRCSVIPSAPRASEDDAAGDDSSGPRKDVAIFVS